MGHNGVKITKVLEMKRKLGISRAIYDAAEMKMIETLGNPETEHEQFA